MINNSNQKILDYLKDLYIECMDNGDYECAQAVRLLFNNFEGNRLELKLLFTDTLLYKGLVYQNRYQLYFEEFMVKKLSYESRVYFDDDPRSFRYLHEFSTIISEYFLKKMQKLIFNTFGIENDEKNRFYYFTVIGQAYKIIPSMYFNSITLDEKINLFNRKFNLNYLIKILKQRNWNINPDSFNKIHKIINVLFSYGYYTKALSFFSFLESRNKNFPNQLKLILYSLKATILFKNEKYSDAIHYYKNSTKYLNNSIDEPLESFYNIPEKIITPSSKSYLKLERLVHIMFSLNKLERKNQYRLNLKKIEEEIYKLENEREISYIYFELSAGFREINLFKKERDFLKKAIEKNLLKHSKHFSNYVENRISDFEETQMNNKLLEIRESETEIGILFQFGELSLSSIFFKESHYFFLK